MKKSSFVEGTLIATLSIFIVKIMGMLYVIPFYAMVGVTGSALYAYAYNIYSIFLDISTAGLPIAISKIINEYETLGKKDAKERAYKIGKQILGIAAVSIFIVLFVFAPQIGRLLIGNLDGGNTYQDIALAIRCVSFAILVVPFLSVSKGYLQGHKIISVSSISQVIEQIVRITIILLGCYITIKVLHLNVTTAVCIAVSGAFFGALISYLYVKLKIHRYRKENENTLVKDEEITNKVIIKKIINYSVPFIIINIIFSLYNFSDMVIIMRTLDFLKIPTIDIEFIASSITTWSTKISIIISSVAMGMSTSLIPTIVSAFTLKDFKEVNNKLNQALQMIILISLPMAVGISLLSTPIWSVFYGLKNSAGPMILSIAVFVALLGNLYMITSSTLQSLNKFKLVYKSAIIGLLFNICLDAPIILLYHKIGIPVCLGASTASIIGYSISVIYALYHLKKEHALNYSNTFKLIRSLIIPTLIMSIAVIILKLVLPVNFDNKLSCIIYIAIPSIIGAIIYLYINYKNGNLEKVLGSNLFNRFFGKFKRR